MQMKNVLQSSHIIPTYNNTMLGSHMSDNYIQVESTLGITQIMNVLIANASENDNISTLFVTDHLGRYEGAIKLNELIVARKHTPLESILHREYPYAFDLDELDDVIEKITDMRLESVPVLSHEDHRLLGVLTPSDIVNATEEKLEDDYAKLASLAEDEQDHESTARSIRSRLPWLIILLALGGVVSGVIGLFEQIAKELTAVICFQSLILGMAGNIGTQSLAVTIRELSANQCKKNTYLILKELKIGLCSGAILGGLSFVLMYCYFGFLKATNSVFSLLASVSVASSLFFSMIISSVLGVSIPLLFKKLKIDPAIASGPLITTINDLTAVCIFYGLCYLLLMA